MRAGFLLPCLLLCGCNTFDFLSPTVVEGVVVGAAVSDGESPLSGGPALGAVFLAEATSIRDVSENLITEADGVSLSDDQASAELTLLEDSFWVTDSAALSWETGETYTLELDRGGELFVGSVVAPEPPTLGGIPQLVSLADLPDDWSTVTQQELEQLAAGAAQGELHEAGQGLTVELTGDYEYWVLAVVDQDGEVTFDSAPTDVSGLIDWVLESEPITTFEIPASAFPEPGRLYAVGVAGVRFTETKNYDGFNWLISNLGAGTLTVAPVVTGPTR